MRKLKREKPVFNFFADLGEKIVSPWSVFERSSTLKKKTATVKKKKLQLRKKQP